MLAKSQHKIYASKHLCDRSIFQDSGTDPYEELLSQPHISIVPLASVKLPLGTNVAH